MLPVFYCESSSGNAFFFSWSNFLALWGRCWWCKISKVLCQHPREPSAMFSPLPSHGAEKGRGACESPPDPVAAAGGTTLVPQSPHRQHADDSSTLLVQVVGDRGIFCRKKRLHREKQLSRFQMKMLLVTEMIGGVSWSNWNCKIIRIRVHRVHTEVVQVIHCILLGQFLRK